MHPDVFIVLLPHPVPFKLVPELSEKHQHAVQGPCTRVSFLGTDPCVPIYVCLLFLEGDSACVWQNCITACAHQ